MNQIIKILLDHPDKTERFFLWFMQSAIIIGGMSYFTGYNIFQIKSVDGTIEFNLTGQLSALRLANYLFIFAISWIIVWGLLADLLIQVSFSSLNWVIRQVRVILWNIFLKVLYLFLIALSCVKVIPKPRPFYKSKKNEDENFKPNEFHEKTQLVTKELEFFYELNKWTKSSLGNELLLEITSFEQGEFIRSRMIRYYSITVILSIIQFIVLDFSVHQTFKISLLFLLFFVGLIVFGFNDLYTKLNESTCYYLIPKLEFGVFLIKLKNSISESILIGDYNIENKRSTIYLSLKESSETVEFENKYFREIKIIPLFEKVFSTIEVIQRNKNYENLVIYISEELPCLQIRNMIEQNKQCLIVAKNSEELFEGIDRIYSIIKKEIEM